MVSWLAAKVGPEGEVVATDIDTSLLASAARPPVRVLVHDVGAEEPPGEGFDLVHARLVLVHVPDRERALRSMIEALRPGGMLLIEDADPALQPLVCPDEHGPEERLANRLRQGFRRLLADRGADLSYGRRLPRLLREAGLRDVEADAYFPSPPRPAPPWSRRPSGRFATVSSPPVSRRTRTSTVIWRMSRPAGWTWPPPR